jgi:hypothetical protein
MPFPLKYIFLPKDWLYWLATSHWADHSHLSDSIFI